ncbi:MAG: NUDIX domain-containing protein [Candidatus Kerfeldbacteria bacterium]
MNSTNPVDICVPIVSAIIERQGRDGTEVLIQTRGGTDKKDPVYTGTLEIPAGWMDQYENVYQALKREVLEETGLHIKKIFPDITTKTFSPRQDEGFAFVPFCCQQMTKGRVPYVGFVFLCQVEDKEPVPQLEELHDIRWVKISVLKQMVDVSPEKFFTLQLGPLDYYLNHYDGRK